MLHRLHGINGLLAVFLSVPLQLGYEVALLLGLLSVVLRKGKGRKKGGEGGEEEGEGRSRGRGGGGGGGEEEREGRRRGRGGGK